MVKCVAIFLPFLLSVLFVYLFIYRGEWMILMTPLGYRYLSFCFIGGRRGGERKSNVIDVLGSGGSDQ